MSNRIYDDISYYNEHQKKRYVSHLDLKSTLNTERIFQRSSRLENQWDTDLYDFTLPQLEQFLDYLNPKTLASSQINVYEVMKYIRWAIEQDLRRDRFGNVNNLNPLESVTVSEFAKKFVDQSERALYTHEEIMQICDTCVNAQDAAPIILIFEGAYGSHGYDELLNLRGEHIHPNNRLELIDGKNKRFIEVSDECMRIVRQALNESSYAKKNGFASESLRSSPEAELVQNGYVLRNVKTRVRNEGKADRHLVSRRIAAVKGYCDDWIGRLSPGIIRNSGMLYMAKRLYKQYGKLEKEQYEIISRHFGLKGRNINGYWTYGYQGRRADFLNVQTLKKVYGIEEEQ